MIRPVEKEAPMADDLRTCATGCCNFIGDESVTREQYGEALRTAPSGGVVETKIPCREALTPAQDAVETAAGFYLGYRVRAGSPLPAGGNPPVFEKGTNKYLGDATPEHYKIWRAETRRRQQTAGE
jgi:hypothetical protein